MVNPRRSQSWSATEDGGRSRKLWRCDGEMTAGCNRTWRGTKTQSTARRRRSLEQTQNPVPGQGFCVTGQQHPVGPRTKTATSLATARFYHLSYFAGWTGQRWRGRGSSGRALLVLLAWTASCLPPRKQVDFSKLLATVGNRTCIRTQWGASGRVGE